MTRLTAAVVALALPLELIVIASAVAGIEERRQAELDNAVLVGQALGAVVDGFAGDLQSTTLATALALGQQAGPIDQGVAGPYLQTVAQQYPALRALFVTDTNGRLIATGTGGALGFDLSSRPYISALRAGAESVWSGGIAGVQTGETTVAFGRVVRGPDGSPRAFLIAAFYPQQLFESLPVRLPADARVMVIDNHGELLYDSDPIGQPPDVPPSDELRAALGGQVVRIVGQPVPAEGEARFGVLEPIARLGWVVGYTRPRAAVDTALATQALAQVGGTVLVIVAAAGVMILIARSLTRPLTTLYATAEAIARGERPTIPALHADQELEQLASAMRVMGAAVAERETDLIAQREWLRVTLGSIGDAVIATDAAGRIAFMNAPAAELCGVSEESALGQDVEEVAELRNERTNARAGSPIERVLREGMVVGLANHTVLVGKDGVTRPIDDSAAPIRDANGELIGVVMVFRDVSEQRQGENALRESEARFRLAVEASPVILFTNDRELRYTWASRPFPGFAADALLGRTDAEIFPPEMAEPMLALKRRALDLGTRVEGEAALPVGAQASTTTLRSWALTIEPFRDATGEVVGLTGAAVDVTEQRALERLQQEFISMVSHELRNPLTSIKGYAQLLDRRRAYNERAVQTIIRQGEQLDRLISDLLDSSRLQAGRLELRRQHVDLLQAVAAGVERAQTQTDRHTIRFDAPAGPVGGLWDAERLDQILNNLLSNAIKYSPDGGEILVQVERRDGEARVSIQDQGVGIEPDQLARLFDRFFRATSTAGRVQGLGVGLYVARELVEAHGGRITAASDGPGHGSTFRFTLPLVSATVEDAGADGLVLVVDDDVSLRELIGEALRGEGYRVVDAGDGLEAIELVEAEAPSLILLDWMMPRMDGESFAAELRRRRPETRIPIVVVTAGGEARSRADSIQAAGFIRKPFELMHLLDEVARLVRAGEQTA